jgi:hypothetical protein
MAKVGFRLTLGVENKSNRSYTKEFDPPSSVRGPRICAPFFSADILPPIDQAD